VSVAVNVMLLFSGIIVDLLQFQRPEGLVSRCG
jgi:hypothetical protein